LTHTRELDSKAHLSLTQSTRAVWQFHQELTVLVQKIDALQRRSESLGRSLSEWRHSVGTG
jgi:hypothetical protein